MGPPCARQRTSGFTDCAGVADFLHADCRALKCESGFRTDRAAYCGAHVRDDNIRTDFCHILGFFRIEDVDDCEKIHLVCDADRLDLFVETHSCLFECHPKGAINHTDGWEVINAVKADIADLF